MFLRKVTIVTGASENHKKSLIQFLSTVNHNLFDCVVYDLGLENSTLTLIKSLFPTINYRTFDFSVYPAYYNIRINAGEYAWKPAIIREVLMEIKCNSYTTEILVWCDSGNKCKTATLTSLINFTYQNKIYSPTSSGDIRKWTYPASYQWFGISSDSDILTYTNRNGAILGFNITASDVCDFIEEFAHCASIKDCIAPEGSSRVNHRQDQAIFTILYYKFMTAHPHLQKCDAYLDMSIHNDID
jgi:hypothetical protein